MSQSRTRGLGFAWILAKKVKTGLSVCYKITFCSYYYSATYGCNNSYSGEGVKVCGVFFFVGPIFGVGMTQESGRDLAAVHFLFYYWFLNLTINIYLWGGGGGNLWVESCGRFCPGAVKCIFSVLANKRLYNLIPDQSWKGEGDNNATYYSTPEKRGHQQRGRDCTLTF